MRFIAPAVVLALLVGCSSEPASEEPTAEDVGSVSSAVCGTDDASWASFPAGNGTQQCVGGVRTFYQNKFGAFVPPASGGPYGNCARYGACNIWVNPVNRPSSAKWNRYAWGGAVKPQKYDMIVYEASAAHPYGHIASVDHYSAGTAWVMDSNYSPWTGRKAACVHNTPGHTPYGFYRLKSLEPATPPATPVAPTACHSTAGGFSFACDGAVKDETCVQITVAGDTAWKSDYFCSEDDDVGMKWSEKGPIAGMTCTNITQTGATATIAAAWKNNYLCLPEGSQYTFTWSEKGAIAGQTCTRWNESTDTASTALDNYLCVDIQDVSAPAESDDNDDVEAPAFPTPAVTAPDAPVAAAADDSSGGCNAAPGPRGAGTFALALAALAAIVARRRSR